MFCPSLYIKLQICRDFAPRESKHLILSVSNLWLQIQEIRCLDLDACYIGPLEGPGSPGPIDLTEHPGAQGGPLGRTGCCSQIGHRRPIGAHMNPHGSVRFSIIRAYLFPSNYKFASFMEAGFRPEFKILLPSI